MSRLREAPVNSEAAVAAPVATRPASAAAAVLALQRSAGNQATVRALTRASTSVSVETVELSSPRASIPADGPVTTKVAPDNATGVTFTLKKDTVEPTGAAVDKDGVVTVSEAQEGGTIIVEATSDDGVSKLAYLVVAEKPTTLEATDGTVGSQEGRYAADFVHTFSGKSGDRTKLENTNINERFDTKSVDTPFGTSYTPRVNPVGAEGWFLGASGQMVRPDSLSIDKWMIDVRPFIKSTSNPSPEKQLPQGFTMPQRLHAKTYPSGNLDPAPFTTVDHVRTLEEETFNVFFTTTAGKDSVSLNYEGPPAYRGISASPAKVEASPPKPAEPGATWERTQTYVLAEVVPMSAERIYSIQGDALGCEIVDARSGDVLIGSTPGKITVRASDDKAEHYDEVTIEISPRAATHE